MHDAAGFTAFDSFQHLSFPDIPSPRDRRLPPVRSCRHAPSLHRLLFKLLLISLTLSPRRTSQRVMVDELVELNLVVYGPFIAGGRPARVDNTRRQLAYTT